MNWSAWRMGAPVLRDEVGVDVRSMYREAESIERK